jgi:hypothetical protein
MRIVRGVVVALVLAVLPVGGAAGTSRDAHTRPCHSFYYLLVPGAGEGWYGPTTALVVGYMIGGLPHLTDDPRKAGQLAGVHWRSAEPSVRALREVRRHGMHAAYFRGWRGAVRETRRKLVERVRRCPDVALVLVGYSQGAAVARIALRQLADRPKVVGHLASVVLVGDPMASPAQNVQRVGSDRAHGLTGNTTTLPRSLVRGGGVISSCRPDDVVCAGGRIDSASVTEHGKYANGVAMHWKVATLFRHTVEWLRYAQQGGLTTYNAARRLGRHLRFHVPEINAPNPRWHIDPATLPPGVELVRGHLVGTPTGTKESLYRLTVYASSATIAPSLSFMSKVLLLLYPPSTGRPGTVAITRAADGGPSDGDSSLGEVSADGRYVVFSSTATNLVADDANSHTDVFRFDRVTGSRLLVSRTPSGLPANGDSDTPRVSADGRYVVFHSSASDLVPGTGEVGNIYLWDAGTGTSTLLSRPDASGFASGASESPWISDDGSQVVFRNDAGNLLPDGLSGLVRWRRDTGQLERLTAPSAGAWVGSPWIASSEGRYAALRTSSPGATSTLLTVVDLQTSAPVGSCSFVDPAKSAAGELSEDGRMLAVTLLAEDVPHPLEQRSRRCDTATGVVTDLGVWTDAVDLTRDGQLTVTVQPYTPTKISASSHEQVRLWTASGKGSSAFTTRPRSYTESPLRVAISGDGGAVAYEADSPNVLELEPSGHVDIYVWDRTISP